ncbi:hypothetical protein N9E91_07135 [Alphaproteobacteria bacterium]|jgi:hypothetical protein|nr:hypothetical protein [Alphaproteobacteria bacterium]NCF49651.1 hypothetical protein [Bacteroidota bacterium]
MRLTDRNDRPECHVIPFQIPRTPAQEVAATSIAAVIAVTVLHSSTETPEDRLLDILESSGEVEVLDADDAMADLEASFDALMPQPVNDNTKMAVL